MNSVVGSVVMMSSEHRIGVGRPGDGARPGSPTFPVFPVFAAAACGVLGGHWLAYALTVAGPARRQAVLSATGHGYLRIAGVTALVLLLLALGSAGMTALGARLEPAVQRPTVLMRRLFVRLWLLQAVTFVGLEIGERLAAGAPLRDVLLARVLLVGLLVQGVAAAAGAALLRAVHRATVVLAGILRPTRIAPPPGVAGIPASRVNGPRAAVLAGAAGVRGPPLS